MVYMCKDNAFYPYIGASVCKNICVLHLREGDMKRYLQGSKKCSKLASRIGVCSAVPTKEEFYAHIYKSSQTACAPRVRP